MKTGIRCFKYASIEHFEGGHIKLDVSKLQSGLYILHLSSGDKVNNLKILVEQK